MIDQDEATEEATVTPSQATVRTHLEYTAKNEILSALQRGEISASVLSNFLCLLLQETSNKPSIFYINLAKWLQEMDPENSTILQILENCMGEHPIAAWAKQKLEDFIIEEIPSEV